MVDKRLDLVLQVFLFVAWNETESDFVRPGAVGRLVVGVATGCRYNRYGQQHGKKFHRSHGYPPCGIQLGLDTSQGAPFVHHLRPYCPAGCQRVPLAECPV